MRALVVAPHEKTVRLTERSGPRKPHGGEVLQAARLMKTQSAVSNSSWRCSLKPYDR